jgi:hypothetical protein
MARHTIQMFENRVVVKEHIQKNGEGSHMTRMLVLMQVANHCYVYEIKNVMKS